MSVVNPAPRALACCAYTAAFFAVTAALGIAEGASVLGWCGLTGLVILASAMLIDHPYAAFAVIASYLVTSSVAAVLGDLLHAAAGMSGTALYLAAIKAVETEAGWEGHQHR